MYSASLNVPVIVSPTKLSVQSSGPESDGHLQPIKLATHRIFSPEVSAERISLNDVICFRCGCCFTHILYITGEGVLKFILISIEQDIFLVNNNKKIQT